MIFRKLKYRFFINNLIISIVLCFLVGCKDDVENPEPIIFTTPKILKTEFITDTGFLFRWTYPTNSIGFVYQVSEDIDFSMPLTGEVTIAKDEIQGLKPLTTYYLRVKARYPGGDSPFSSIEILRTLVKLNRFTLTTSDSYHLAAGISYPENEIQDNPAVILLHQVGSSKEEWHGLEIYETLNKNGYVTMIFDHRNHGESDVNFDYTLADLLSDPNAIPVDLEAAVEFLKKDSMVDPERIALIGASMGANLACVGKGNPMLGIKTGVSLSARKTRVEELSANIEEFSLGGMYFIVGQNDSDLAELTVDLYSLTTEPKLLEIIEASSIHGTQILIEYPRFNDNILRWLEENL